MQFEFTKLSDTATQNLRKLTKAMPEIADNVGTAVVMEFKERMRGSYLSGQVLKRRTGRLFGGIRDEHVGTGKSTVYLQWGFYSIYETGMRAGKSIKRRPFWSKTVADMSSGRADKRAEGVIERSLRRMA